ncbi:DUF488 domain-containing protein [Mesobacillus maritimus]|uniref:DUF488 domain-containing protein n=1 Tax=Mesobacillus maritimus TaxID=1643336 RepID=UPI00384DA6E1
MSKIVIKRIYDDVDGSDGTRVLVDRLWPRGISKEKANIRLWAKEVAPSTELRKWFGHRPELYLEFKERYLNELRTGEGKHPKLVELNQLAREGTLTLLYGAKNTVYNHAQVLKEELERLDDNVYK